MIPNRKPSPGFSKTTIEALELLSLRPDGACPGRSNVRPDVETATPIVAAPTARKLVRMGLAEFVRKGFSERYVLTDNGRRVLEIRGLA